MSASVAATTTKSAPSHSPSFVLQRKCACGNSASEMTGECTECQRKSVLGLQKKSAISSVDDPFEREADRAAQHVMSMRDPTSGPRRIEVGAARTQLPVLSRLPATGAGPAPSAVPSSVRSVLHSAGEPLPGSVREYFEPRFGHDFSSVRIHRHALAAESAHAVHARAYTIGNNIAFAAGAYSPGTYGGRALIAHELAHVVQQGHGEQRVQRQPEGGVEETGGGSLAARLDQGMLDTAFDLIEGAARLFPGLAPLAGARSLIRAILYFWEHRQELQAQLIAGIGRAVQTIPQLARAKMEEVLARLGGRTRDAIACVWNQMLTLLDSLAQNWLQVLTTFIEDMFGGVFVRAIPVIIANLGELVTDVTSGEFRRAIDRGVTIMTEINSIVGVLFLWYAIIVTVVGGAAGSEVPVAGNAVGAAAGATVAEVTNIVLLTSVIATEVTRVGRGIDDMVRFWDDERRDAGCRQVAEGVFSLALTAALFYLGPGVQRIARNIIGRAAQALRTGAAAVREGAAALESLTPQLALPGGGAMPFAGPPPAAPRPQLRGPAAPPGTRPSTRPPPTRPAETPPPTRPAEPAPPARPAEPAPPARPAEPAPGRTDPVPETPPAPAEAPGPAPDPIPRAAPAPATEDPSRRTDRCITLFNLRPNQQARWHQQRSPINGHVTVQSAAYRLDAGVPPPAGQRTQQPQVLWVRSIGLPRDDAGHVIAHRFGGTRIHNNDPDGNIFPQDLSINRGRMRTREGEAARLHAAGCDVCAHIMLNYSDGALRPHELIYTIMARQPGAADFDPPVGVPLPNP